MSAASPRRILLLGAGHAHLHVIRHARRFTELGHTLTVVAPGNFWYSGLATGMLGGGYDPAEDQVDVAALATCSGALFVCGAAARIDVQRRSVGLEDGQDLPFDLLSLNLGSFPPDIPGGDGPGCYRVKPIVELARLRDDLLARFAAGEATVSAVIAGGGATGAELAANLAALVRRSGGHVNLKLVTGEGGFLRQMPAGAARAVAAELRYRGVELVHGRVARIAEGVAELDSGRQLAFDVFLNATGLKPSPLVAATGLPVNRHGALRVDAHLRSIADQAVHGAGDCIALEGHALPKIGVFAVRQAPILLANLLAAAGHGEPQIFKPQQRYLWILNFGDGTGVAMRGGLWWRGRSAFRLKDWIDRRFMRGYQDAAATR